MIATGYRYIVDRARVRSGHAIAEGTRALDFPWSIASPWARYVDLKTVDAETGIGTVRYPRLERRDADCAAKLKKRTLTNLYNERPAWLDLAHKKLAAAYGWPA